MNYIQKRGDARMVNGVEVSKRVFGMAIAQNRRLEVQRSRIVQRNAVRILELLQSCARHTLRESPSFYTQQIGRAKRQGKAPEPCGYMYRVPLHPAR